MALCLCLKKTGSCTTTRSNSQCGSTKRSIETRLPSSILTHTQTFEFSNFRRCPIIKIKYRSKMSHADQSRMGQRMGSRQGNRNPQFMTHAWPRSSMKRRSRSKLKRRSLHICRTSFKTRKRSLTTTSMPTWGCRPKMQVRCQTTN